ncbi:MAG TPA: helix-turn-helix domain-containing protein [Candidatus Obscuribacterales bacterium]|jgi:transposase
MARSIQLTIHESQQELEHYLSNRRSATSKERLQMLYWLKRGIAKNRKELAQLLHRNEATISRWLLRYRSGGLAKLLEVKQAPGNRGKIPDEAVARLRQRLSQPEGLHSYGEAQEWLEQECGVKAAYKTVHKLVRYKLQAKLKVPRPRSLKQHPQALEQFKKN